MPKANIGLSLVMLFLVASSCVCAEDGDIEDSDIEGGDSINIVIDDDSGHITILLPQSANGQPSTPSVDDKGKLVPHGKGLLNKSTGTYYEPAGAKGYRNRTTGEYEKAWDCYPRR